MSVYIFHISLGVLECAESDTVRPRSVSLKLIIQDGRHQNGICNVRINGTNSIIFNFFLSMIDENNCKCVKSIIFFKRIKKKIYQKATNTASVVP